MVDVSFAVSPDFTIVAVQFERAAVMLVGILFMRKHDRGASTIRLEVEVEEGRGGRVDDSEDTPVSDGVEHLNLGTDAIEDSHIDVGDVLGLIDMRHFSSF